MNVEIKQISENKKIIFPQTSAEAVLVKDNGKIITLDKRLNKKTIIVVNGNTYKTISGSANQQINFGNDFEVNNDNIGLKWNNI